MNIYGGSKVLSGGWEPLSDEETCMRFLSVRSALGSAAVGFGTEDNTQIGYILASDSKEFRNVSPSSIKVQGTSGTTIYWDGQA